MSSKQYTPVRFAPDDGVAAYISVDIACEEFRNDIQALIMNESYAGCGLVMAETDLLNEGDRCVARIGNLSPMKSTVRWRKADGNGLLRVGLEYG